MTMILDGYYLLALSYVSGFGGLERWNGMVECMHGIASVHVCRSVASFLVGSCNVAIFMCAQTEMERIIACLLARSPKHMRIRPCG